MIRKDKVNPIEIRETASSQEPLLSIQTGTYDNVTHHLDFEVHKGEVVGFYGLVGSGRTEAAEHIYGLRAGRKRSFVFDGETITKEKPNAMIRKGMIMIPEIRGNAVFRSMSLTNNTCALFLRTKLSTKFLGLIKRRDCEQFTEQVIEKNNVKCTGPGQPIGSLSGGNQQKIIVGRSIEVENIKMIIMDEPTTGIDIGAKYELYERIRLLAEENNLGIMFISSELDELMVVCDRICVFRNGNCVKSVPRHAFDKTELLSAAIREERA